MDQLPHSSSSSSSSSRHTTTIVTLPRPMAMSSASASTSQLDLSLSAEAGASKKSKPALPARPSFGRRQRFSPTYIQLSSHIARVQAQPHKPKRPSPLHSSISPEMLETDLESSSPELSSSCSSSLSSPSSCESSPDLQPSPYCLSPIREERSNASANMLGLSLDVSSQSDDGFCWTCELQERMKEPKTPFPSPAILI